ncbi:hypothetical protein [Paenibacillus sp. FSL H3-0333]|uniref:hypothetical protein n=1 Tax=Paenibacillus sp. FSL H3-0333 TaxID=2921373 RepID=UPI0030F5D9B5
MNLDDFHNKYNEPVDLDKVHEALKRFINKQGRMSVLVNPDDDDMLICRLMAEVERQREKTKSKEEIYVVQGRSGIVFSATTNYDEAVKVKDGLNEIESDRGIMSYWENNKCVLRD